MIATTTNFARRHLTASQKAAIAAELLPQYEEEAKAREAVRKSTPAKLPESDKGDARDQAATAVGVSPRYVSDAKKLKEESPEEFVWSTMMRKNHSESQLSIFAAEWQKTKGPKKRGPKKKDDSNSGTVAGISEGDTRDVAADKFGIGGRTVSKAANVLDKGCDQLQQAVKDGRVNVSLAEKVAKRQPLWLPFGRVRRIGSRRAAKKRLGKELPKLLTIERPTPQEPS